MSFLCIPGVFGRRKDREFDFDDADLVGGSAKTSPPNDKAPQNPPDHPRNPLPSRPSSSRLPPSPSEGTPGSEGTTAPSLFHGATALQFEDFKYIDASRASNVVISSETHATDASDRGGS